MTQLSITVDGQLVRQGLEDLSKEIPLIGRRRIRTVINRIIRRMGKAGAKPIYPIRWDSEKQRRAFFASDGFGHGIPTRRTGAYTNSWKIEPIDNGYMVVNRSGYSQYLGGDAYGVVHSGIHRGRWENLRVVVDLETLSLPEEIDDDIIMVARRVGL